MSNSSRAELNVLGGFQLLTGDSSDARPLSPRMQAALTWLILHRSAPSPRELVAGTLWPDSPAAQAKTNLRNLLHRLRTVAPELGDAIKTPGADIVWGPGEALRVDLVRFEAQADEAKTVEEIEAAIACYRGPLLPGCDDDWLTFERDRLARRLQTLLGQAVSLHEAARRYPNAIEAARRLLALDPLREETHRSLMRLYALGGDRAAALNQYRQCVETLGAELGVYPSESTRAMYKRLQQRGGEVDSGRSPASPPLIGRAAEWSRLQISWLAASAGTSFVALIEGEAGIGKTRLAREMLGWAADQGITTVFAHSDRVQHRLPYGTAIEILKRCALDRLPMVWKQELAPLHPTILGEEDARLRAGSPSGLRACLFDAMSAAITLQEPCVVCIDDVQWCDSDTLDWLNVVLMRHPKARILWLLTLRGDDPDSAQLQHLIAALSSAGRLQRLRLTPLNRQDATELSLKVAAHELAPPVVDALLKRSMGNPLFLIETIRAGLHRGEASELELPRAVESVFESKLSHLSERALTLAELAAVMGGKWTPEQLAAIARMSIAEALILIEELWERGIFIEEAEDHLAFSHDLIAAYLYRRLSRFRRRARHLQIGESLVGMVEKDHQGIAEAARHMELGGMPRSAIPLFVRAGTHALQVHAHERALLCLTHARELLETHPDDALSFEAIKGQELARRALGQTDGQGPLLDELVEIAQRRGRADWLAYAYLRLADLHLYRGHPVQALEFAERAVHHARACRDVELEASAALGRAMALQHSTSDYQLMLHSLESAEIHARRAGLSTQLGTICARKAACLSMLGRLPEAEATMHDALEAAQAGGSLVELARVRLHEGKLRCNQGQWDAAEAAYQACLTLSKQTHHATMLSAAHSHLADLHSRLRRLPSSLEHTEAALRHLEPYPFGWVRCGYMHSRGLLRLALGERSAGWEDFNLARAIADGAGKATAKAPIMGEQVFTAMICDDWAQAEALSEETEALSTTCFGLALIRIQKELDLASFLLSVSRGATEGAEARFQAHLDTLHLGALALDVQDLRLALSRALARGGDLDAADRVALAVARAIDEAPIPPLLAGREGFPLWRAEAQEARPRRRAPGGR